MDHFFSSITFIVILLILHIYYGTHQMKMNQAFVPLPSGLLILWVLICGFVFQYSHWPSILLLVMMSISVLAFYQDWTTQYFSKRWLILFFIIPFLIPYCPVDQSSRWLAGVCASVMGIAVHFHWLGIADWMYMIVIGGLIGFERWILLLLTSSIMSLVDGMCAHKTYIPFISALVINTVWIVALTF